MRLSWIVIASVACGRDAPARAPAPAPARSSDAAAVAAARDASAAPDPDEEMARLLRADDGGAAFVAAARAHPDQALDALARLTNPLEPAVTADRVDALCALLDVPRLGDGVAEAIVELVDDGKLPRDLPGRHRDALVADLRAARTALDRARAGGDADAIADAANVVGVYADLARYLGGDDVLAALRELAADRDPTIAQFALSALVDHGETPPADQIARVAANDATRGYLYGHLGDARDTMPPEDRTQEALARADLVQWLIFPTELGSAPDEIQLARVVPADASHDLYVFRFRVKPPHWAADQGWMWGVAGPYTRGADPLETRGSSTFSSFDRVATTSLDAYLAKIR